MINMKNEKKMSSFYSFISKLPIAMRTTLFLLFVLVLQINAEPTYSQNTRISLDMKNVSVEKVLQTIEQKSDYYFLYNNRLVNVDRKVDVSVNNATIAEILDFLFSSSNVEYSVRKSQIVLSLKQTSKDMVSLPSVKNTQQKKKSISGKITDVHGEPIIGANIIEVGKPANGTTSDFDGNFSFQVEDDAVIRVSYLGFLDMEIKTEGKSSFKITLQEDTQTLDELVVVGYSTQRKESLTGALQTIKSEKLKDITTPTVENLLNGKVPGVYVAPGSGQPGQTGTIVIRGKSTISGSTDPLWVVDGVIVGSSAGTINPADIETMTVLKDAASTAIYGSQGANGVIVVTTKSPKVDKLTMTLSAKGGITSLNNGNLHVMNGRELYDYYKSFANVEEVKFGERSEEDVKNSNFDWWDFASQTGVVQDYNLSISGGSKKLRSLVSVGMYDEKGAVKGYDFKRYNFLFKNDFRPTDWLTVKPALSGSRGDIDNRQYSVGAMYSNLPWDSPYDKDGNIIPNRSKLWVNSNSTNYIYDLQWNFSKSTTYEFMGNFDFDIKLTDWLTFASVNNIKYRGGSSKSYEDPRSSSAEGVKGRVGEYRSEMIRRYTNQLLRLNKLIDKHSWNALLAYEFNDYRGSGLSASGIGFVPGFEVLDVTSKPERAKGGISEWAVQSFFTNVNYAYDNRYLGQVSLRRDGASNFGDNAKYGNFFSLSAGWNIHHEAFFKADWIDVLKLRVAYGSVGNRPTSLYPQYDLYSVSAGAGYNENPGALISQVGNKDLTWEKSYTSGVGVDASMFNRLRLTLDFYNRNTSELLYQVPVSGMTGVTRVWRNVGAVNNKGFEASLGIDILNRKDLMWSVDFNIGTNQNKVTELYGDILPETNKPKPIIAGDGSGIAGSADKILDVGYDADTWYLREWAGVNPDNGAPLWYKTVTDAKGNKTREKTEKYEEADQVKMGAYTPKFFGGFSTSFVWKQFDANAVFGYSVGGKIYNYSRQEYDADGAYSDRNQMKLMPSWNRWKKPGDIATHPVARYNNKSNSQKVSSRYLEDGTYLKLRSVTLGYNLSLPQYNISNLRLFVMGENLFTITDYSGVDPEIPTYEDAWGTRKITGVTTTVYPTTRKFMVGFNLTF